MEFREAGAEVVGASVDPPELNAVFRTKEQLHFELVSDPTRELVTALGITRESETRGVIARRVTYLLDADGTIVKVWEVEDIDSHPGEVLEEVRTYVRASGSDDPSR